MSKDPENLKVIFYEPAAESKEGVIVASGYFSFVPSFKQGELINITPAQREAADQVVHNPIGHKTHEVTATDWVIMVDEPSSEALATLIVSVAKINGTPTTSSVMGSSVTYS